MYGIDANLDLSAFVGRRISRLLPSAHQMQLHLAPDGNISVESRIDVCDQGGQVTSQWVAGTASAPKELEAIVGALIVSAEVQLPDAVVFAFDNGVAIRLVDASNAHESFQLEPGGIIV